MPRITYIRGVWGSRARTRMPSRDRVLFQSQLRPGVEIHHLKLLVFAVFGPTLRGSIACCVPILQNVSTMWSVLSQNRLNHWRNDTFSAAWSGEHTSRWRQIGPSRSPRLSLAMVSINKRDDKSAPAGDRHTHRRQDAGDRSRSALVKANLDRLADRLGAGQRSRLYLAGCLHVVQPHAFILLFTFTL